MYLKKELSLENEEWRELPQCDGKYQVSNFGRIMLAKPRIGEPRIMCQSETRDGYLMVRLKFDGCDFKPYSVHRIVAKMFIPNPLDLTEVNHKDGNKKNNCVDNLEWCTRSENVLHAFAMGLKKNKKGADHPNAVIVYQYDLQGNLIKEWKCINEASEILGLEHTNISYACSGKIKTCGGFIWSYELRTINPQDHERETNGKLIYQYTKKGEFVATYESAHKAQEMTGNDYSLICSCCRGKRLSTGGYVWSYEPLEPSSTRFKRHLGNGSKKVYQYTLNGEYIAEYDNLTIAQEQTNVDKRCISECAIGHAKTAGGYLWRYERI